MTLKRKILILCILMTLFLTYSNAQDSIKIRTDHNIKYEFSYTLSAGGESKLSLLFPKINFVRKHVYSKSILYYGFGVGVHVHFLGGWGTLNGLVGFEKKRLDLESSYSYVWITEIKRTDKPSMGPCNQNLINLKIGYKFKYSKLRFVTSYVISEMTPNGHDRNPLMDVGRINDNFVLGLEFTSIINRD